MKPTNPNSGWFDQKENIRKVLLGLFSACASLIVVDIVFALVSYDKHPYFHWEEWPGFYAACGFVFSTIIVLISKYLVRPLVKRSENFYETEAISDSSEDPKH